MSNPIDVVAIDGGVEAKTRLISALYENLISKTDVFYKEYSSAKKVERRDIEQLIIKLNQNEMQYNKISSSCQINVRLRGGSSWSFKSIEKFMDSDSSNNEPTQYIEVEYNMLILNPSGDHDEYKIEILMPNTIFDGGSSTFLAEIMGLVTFQTKITYVNFMVCRNIQVIIDDWISSLEDLEKNYVFLKLKPFYAGIKRSDLPGRFVYVLASFVALYAIYKLSYRFEVQEYRGLMNFSLMSFGIYVLTTRVVCASHGVLADVVSAYRMPCIIRYNRGDEKNYSKFKGLLFSDLKKVLGSLFVILLSIILNLFSSYIYDLLKSIV